MSEDPRVELIRSALREHAPMLASAEPTIEIAQEEHPELDRPIVHVRLTGPQSRSHGLSPMGKAVLMAALADALGCPPDHLRLQLGPE